MKIENLRTSFTVYLISSEAEALKSAADVIIEAGYVCLRFDRLTDAFSEIFTNPPHIVIFDIGEKKFSLKAAFAEITAQLPESHILLQAPVSLREQVAEYSQLGLYDVLWTPPISAREWIKALDRATERDYFMYMNEQLQSTTKGGSESHLTGLIDFHKKLITRTQTIDCVQDFLNFGAQMLGGGSAIFLRCLPLRRILLATQATGLDEEQWRGVGVNLNEDPAFRWAMLHDPQRLIPLREMVKEIYKRDEFQAFGLELAKEPAGVIVFMGVKVDPSVLEIIALAKEFLQVYAGAVEMEKRFHSVSVKDDATGLYNRNHLMERVAAEVTRSRRSHHPLSLVLISIDSFSQAIKQGGSEDGLTLFRLLVKSFIKHSRINDIMAKLGDGEMALLLPDTNLEGAAIKAERLRRMVSTGDFGKVISFLPKVTISAGISEYPTVCTDAHDLFQTADEALNQARAKGNRVCMSKAPMSFQPDFKPNDKLEPV